MSDYEDASQVATEVVRRQIAKIEVIDVQRSDLKQLHDGASEAAYWMGWFTFTAGLFTSGAMSALVTPWSTLSAPVTGMYCAVLLVSLLLTCVFGGAWWRRKQSARAKYDEIIEQATIEVSSRVVLRRPVS